MNLDCLTDLVWQRLTEGKPRALLIGEAPEDYHKYNYVNTEPYESVFLGILPPGDLLHMPDDTVCRALLAGIPVYLWPEQPYKYAVHGRLLCRELKAAEERLKRFGVVPVGIERQLITAEMARKMVLSGEKSELNSRMTPLARDILEGRTL